MLVLRKAIDEIDELRAENQMLKSELRNTMQAYRTLARVSEQGMCAWYTKCCKSGVGPS